MDQLVNNLKEVFASSFDATVTSINLSRDYDSWDFMHSQAPVGTFSLHVEIEELRDWVKNKDAQTIQWYVKRGIFDQILGECGRIESITTRMSHDGFKTSLNFKTHDIEAFTNSLKDFAWKKYSQEFESLLEEKILKD